MGWAYLQGLFTPWSIISLYGLSSKISDFFPLQRIPWIFPLGMLPKNLK